MDKTATAVRNQVSSMGADLYEIGVRKQESGQMRIKTLALKEIEKNLAWLKSQNAQGNDIYIRPALDHNPGIVLVDDLSTSALVAMKQAGHEPALVTETSPGNFQAWIKVPSTTDAQRSEIGRILATKYGGDPNSTDHRHFGRLAGFTNRKPKHRNEKGYQPWVLLRSSGGEVASAGTDLVDEANRSLLLKQSSTKKDQVNAPPSLERVSKQDPAKLFQSEIDRQGAYTKDQSVAEFRAVALLARVGFTREEAAMALREASGLSQRKTTHVDDYVLRTVSKAFAYTQSRKSQVKGDIS